MPPGNGWCACCQRCRLLDRHAELRTPELADLREPTRTDGRDISRIDSAIYVATWCATGRAQLAGDLARRVVSEEPADRFGGGGQPLGVLPRLEQLGGRRERGDLAAGLGRVVLIDSGQDEHRRAEGPHLVPGHADSEVGSPHRGGERLDLIAAEIVTLAHELLTPLLPEVVKQLPVARDDPDRLLEDGRDDSFRRQVEQLEDERAADAAAEHQEPVDAEMIHDGELVCRVGAPRVAGLQRAGGPAGVALVHRDHPVLPGVRGQRVDRRHLPQRHARAHPAWRQRQHGKPCPLLGVPDLRLATVDVRHTRLLSRLRFRDPAYGRPPATTELLAWAGEARSRAGRGGYRHDLPVILGSYAAGGATVPV